MSSKVNTRAIVAAALKDLVDLRADDLSDYLDLIERKLAAELRERADQYANDVERLPERDQAVLQDAFGEEYFQIRKTFTPLLRYSMVVTAYSFLESSMYSLCRRLARRDRHRVLPDDLKGEGIIRAHDYLVKICGVTFPDTSHAWQEILKLNKIRNLIVHAEGYITRTPKPTQLRALIRQTKGLDLIDRKRLGINRTYLTTAIDHIRTLLKALYAASY